MNKVLIAFIFLSSTFLAAQVAETQAGNQAWPIAQTLHGKHIVGYQGWFTCPSDHSGGWGHWFFSNAADKNQMTVDMLPAGEELTIRERCETGWTTSDGSSVALFSSLNPTTVDRHLRWMREYDIDGLALERFVSNIYKPEELARRDRVLKNVMAAALTQKRAFFIMYDISGTDPARWINLITTDWNHLLHDLKVTEHPGYWRENGLPVLAIWGTGFVDHPGTPAETLSLIKQLKQDQGGLTLIGGVPSRWRTRTRDSKSDAAWAEVYKAFDILSPWTVGRYADAPTWREYMRTVLEPDLQAMRLTKQGYLPVIWPGYSFQNAGKKPSLFNLIKRRCGSFYTMQAHDLDTLGVSSLYTAMFDEVNEGTAIFKVAAHQGDIPEGVSVITLDENNCHLQSDSYLSLAREITRSLRISTGK
jgi:hypothetical protein